MGSLLAKALARAILTASALPMMEINQGNIKPFGPPPLTETHMP